VGKELFEKSSLRLHKMAFASKFVGLCWLVCCMSIFLPRFLRGPFFDVCGILRGFGDRFLGGEAEVGWPGRVVFTKFRGRLMWDICGLVVSSGIWKECQIYGL
jgi:hypothetical protein